MHDNWHEKTDNLFSQKKSGVRCGTPDQKHCTKILYQLPVVKVAEEEYGDIPEVQILRTWNS